MGKKRQQLLDSIASMIADYREGEIAKPSPKHVDQWVRQFDPSVQDAILAEMQYVIQRAYVTRKGAEDFLRGLVQNVALVGSDPCKFWRTACVLKIQTQGGSQTQMVAMFDDALRRKCGFTSSMNPAGAGPFIYIDDGIYTGMRVINDLKPLIVNKAPKNCCVHVIVIALHCGGQHYAATTLQSHAANVGKSIELKWWRIVEIENTPRCRDQSDVLWPTALPGDPLVQAYAKMLTDAGHPPQPRTPGSVGPAGFFSSDEGRQLLEQEFLKAGALIRKKCPNLKIYHRPLGNMVLQTLGFGAVIVTFRNCPNNCPLAWWAGNPWYPLFPRKTN